VCEVVCYTEVRPGLSGKKMRWHFSAPPASVIHVLNRDNRACRNAHLLDSCGRLNAVYAALYWPVLECLTVAILVSDLSRAAAARGN